MRKDGVHIKGSPFSPESMSTLGSSIPLMSVTEGNGLLGAVAGHPDKSEMLLMARNSIGPWKPPAPTLHIKHSIIRTLCI